MASPFVCLLCKAAGQPTLAPRDGKKAICQDHADMLRATGRAWCSRGRHAAPQAEMRRHICRTCDNARRAAAYAANREAECAAQRARYEANREREIARVAAWKAANPERQRAHVRNYMRRWRQANPARHLENNARYRERNREHIRVLGRAARLRKKLAVLRSFRAA